MYKLYFKRELPVFRIDDLEHQYLWACVYLEVMKTVHIDTNNNNANNDKNYPNIAHLLHIAHLLPLGFFIVKGWIQSFPCVKLLFENRIKLYDYLFSLHLKMKTMKDT